MHRGVNNDSHDIRFINQDLTESNKFPPIWELIADANKSIGIFGSLQTGEPFVNQVFLGFGGGAGSHATDAWVTIAHVGNAGMCYQDSIEIDEQVFPIFVKGRHFIPDSGGAGCYRGGAGIYKTSSTLYFKF